MSRIETKGNLLITSSHMVSQISFDSFIGNRHIDSQIGFDSFIGNLHID